MDSCYVVHAGLKLMSSRGVFCFSLLRSCHYRDHPAQLWPVLTGPRHTGAVTCFPELSMAPLRPSQGTEPMSTYVMRCREQSQKSISMARSCLDSPVSLFRHSKKSFNPPWGPSSQIKAQSLGSRSSRYVRPGKGEKPKRQGGSSCSAVSPSPGESATLRPARQGASALSHDSRSSRHWTDALKCQTPLCSLCGSPPTGPSAALLCR